jgi:hypothetical protein
MIDDELSEQSTGGRALGALAQEPRHGDVVPRSFEMKVVNHGD